MVTRIRQLLDTKQLTPTQFADIIGVGRPVMSHILSERNKPSLEVVQRIINAFPEVSVHWLLSGLGEMLGEATVAAPAPPPTAIETQVAPTLTSAAPPVEEPVAANSPVMPAVEEPQQTPVAETPAAPVAAPAPATPTPAPSPVAPATPQPLAAAPQALPTAEALNTVPTPTPAPVAPTAMQPFRAARFVPAAARVPVAAPRKPASPTLPAPETAVLPLAAPVPVRPAADLPAPGPGTVPTVSSQSPEAALLPFLGEPGKEIKRIVIFYRDGSFADYQPEA